jgi:hypothetical protein
MLRASIPALCLLLAACGANAAREELPAPQLPQRTGVDPLVAARAEGVEFRAVGEGFVLDIFRAERIRLTLTATGEELVFPKTEPRYPRWSGSIYDTSNGTRRLHIEIRNYRNCESADSAAYPDTVRVRLDQRELQGCGRAF